MPLSRLIFLSFVLIVAACSQGPRAIAVSDAWVPVPPAGAQVGAGYMRIYNGTAADVRLTGGRTDIAERVELHSMTMDGGVMRMRPLADGLAIAAGETATLGPGGLHLMLIGLKRQPVEGERVALTLIFEGGQSVDVQLDVRAKGGHEH